LGEIWNKATRKSVPIHIQESVSSPAR
jgi:hypothetical protein